MSALPKEPLISIIIPSYNRASFIADTLQSVCKQTYTNWECIVVDDGSTDKTESVVSDFVKADQRISFYKRPSHKPKGANSCRNYGFEKSSGQYINWLDSDDLLDTNHFQSHLHQHQKASVDATVSVVQTFENSPQEPIGLWANPFPAADVIDEMIHAQVSWQTASALWKRSALPISPFDERLQSSQEWTFHMQQLVGGISYSILETPTVFVRRHEQRVGNDFSAKKYRSMFLSRYRVFKILRKENALSGHREKGLLKRMFQAAKGASREKYVGTSFWQWRQLIMLLPKSRFPVPILRVVLLGIPLYLILGSGEKLFKL